jgi:hypothetical protein
MNLYIVKMIIYFIIMLYWYMDLYIVKNDNISHNYVILLKIICSL